MSGNYQIPFDKNTGNMCRYDGGGAEWRDNFVFKNELAFALFGRGRSAAYAIFIGNNGKKYYMFLRDLQEAMPKMCEGLLSGDFTFIKRGANYGVRLVMEDKKNEHSLFNR